MGQGKEGGGRLRLALGRDGVIMFAVCIACPGKGLIYQELEWAVYTGGQGRLGAWHASLLGGNVCRGSVSELLVLTKGSSMSSLD